MKVLLTGCWIVLAILVYSCRKEDPPTIPIVETVIITDITQSTATGGGQIVSDGGKPVISRGVCWGETNQPKTTDSKTTDGAGDGSFVSSITGLAPGVLYYVRAYATNGVGTGYGDPVSFKTSPVVQAEITTTIISDITANSAKSGGTIISNGGGEITASGVCWSLNHEPKITDRKTTDAISGNSFTSTLTNLEHFKTYYVRAYATNSAGTVYGNEREFKTEAMPPTVTTNEVTNRSYRSATVGGEVTADGGNPVTDKGICYATHLNPKFNENNMPAGTGLGPFTVDLTGLEPNTIYHVRTYAATAADTIYGVDVEFRTLETTIPVITTHTIYGTTNCTATSGGEILSDGGEPILSKGICWSSTKLEPTISDESGNWGSGSSSFVAPFENLTPGTGYYVRAYATNSKGTGYGTALSFSTPCNPPMIYEQRALEVFSTSARLLTTTDLAESAIFFLTNTSTGGILTIYPQGSGNPCGVNSFIVDATGLERGTTYSCEVHAVNICAGMVSSPFTFTTLNTPSLTTIAASAITSNSAISGGNISSDGGSLVTERGVCWGKNTNPTLGDYHRTSGSGTGPFSVTINGLEENTEYHLRSYATNGIGTAYGQDEVFKTGLAPITDIDGNSYKVVQIGTQLWMAENLKTTKNRDGTTIPLVGDQTIWVGLTTGAMCFYNNEELTNNPVYGALYNWYSIADPRGLCPVGWHVPSDEEWKTLEMNLGMSQSEADRSADFRGTDEGGKLKETGTIHWVYPNIGATNSSGFTALPAGYRMSAFYDLRNWGQWWSSTSNDNATAWNRSLNFNYQRVRRDDYSKKAGSSVRCVKD